jgi:hypothetical protein
MSQQMNGSGIDRDTICTVKLKAEQWEQVLNSLGKMPYEMAAPLIQAIVPQVMQQANTPGGQEQQAEHIPSREVN